MKVCGIVGSPVKKGSVDLLVSRVLEGAKSERAETEKIYLNDLKIRPCQDCVKDPDPEYCLFDDDMKVIYDALDSCDVIVLGSPLYFDTVSAQTKLMIDRCNCLMPYVKREDGTYGFERRKKSRNKGIFIAVGGQDRDFTPILTRSGAASRTTKRPWLRHLRLASESPRQQNGRNSRYSTFTIAWPQQTSSPPPASLTSTTFPQISHRNTSPTSLTRTIVPPWSLSLTVQRAYVNLTTSS
jgi:multimeric flavodoxin WrbA